MGFLGPGPIEAHLEHAERFAAATSPPDRALDLGSGGGIPGLPLALAWPASRWTLLDAQQRRGAFLEQACRELRIADRVEVVVGRAEEVAHRPAFRGGFDLVVSRSFGPPAVTAECACGFLAPGGWLLVSEPPINSDDRWPVGPLAELGLEDQAVRSGIRVLVQRTRAPVTVPRRVGVPGKRPRWR